MNKEICYGYIDGPNGGLIMEQRIIYKAVKKEFRFTEDEKIFEKLIALIDEILGERC